MTHLTTKHLLLTTAIAGSLMTQAATAQSSNTAPGVIDRPTPSVSVPKNYNLNKPVNNESKITPAKEKVDNADASIPSISSVSFSGNTVLDETILQQIASGYVNKPLTKSDLAKLKFDLTKAFYDAGFILVKVTTPPQSLSDGTLNVEIHEATIGEIVIHNDDILYAPHAKNLVNRLRRGSVFSETTAETVISDLDDIQNVAASMNLQPGKKFKTTDLHVFLDETSEDEYSATFDNYGADLTGDHVGSVFLEHSNFLQLGETISLSGRKSDGDLESINLGYMMPTGFYGTHLDANLTYTDSELGKSLSPLDIKGQTNTIDIALYKNLINTNTEKLTTTIGMDFRTHKSSLAGVLNSRDKIRQVYAEASYLLRVDSAVLFGAGRITKGTSLFDATREGQQFATVQKGDPDAWRFQPTALINWAPIDGGILKIYSTAQFASDTLLSSDLFAIGGYGSVRGFEPAQATGENGYIVNVEYLHEIPAGDQVILSAGPWFDAGAVYNRQPGNVQDSHLSAAGLGLELTTDIIPNVGDTIVRLDWAHTLDSYRDTDIDDNTFYFRVTQNF